MATKKKTVTVSVEELDQILESLQDLQRRWERLRTRLRQGIETRERGQPAPGKKRKDTGK
jgi:hypothetical protein